MKNSITKTILTIVAVIAVVVFMVYLLGIALDKEGKIHCKDLQAQAVQFGTTYRKWAEENPKAHATDVSFCKSQYDVEIVLK